MVYENVLPYVTLIVDNWRQRNTPYDVAVGESETKSDNDLSEVIELHRKKMTANVYAELGKNPTANVTEVIRSVYEAWTKLTDKPTLDYFLEEMRLIS
jgi:hypothetical protein